MMLSLWMCECESRAQVLVVLTAGDEPLYSPVLPESVTIPSQLLLSCQQLPVVAQCCQSLHHPLTGVAGNSATNRSDSGDSGNPGLQRATAGNSATTGWRLWQL